MYKFNDLLKMYSVSSRHDAPFGEVVLAPTPIPSTWQSSSVSPLQLAEPGERLLRRATRVCPLSGLLPQSRGRWAAGLPPSSVLLEESSAILLNSQWRRRRSSFPGSRVPVLILIPALILRRKGRFSS